MLNTPVQMILAMLAGWLNEEQRAVIGYLREENRVLRELHGNKRLRFSDDQRRRLAAKGKALGRRVLSECGSLVAPVLFQYSTDRSSGFTIVVAEDAAQPFLSSDRP